MNNKENKLYTKDNKVCKKMKYACAYVLPQVYENLYSPDEAIKVGTIFKDLYRPYEATEKSDNNKSSCQKKSSCYK
jgi:hypothetical protein